MIVFHIFGTVVHYFCSAMSILYNKWVLLAPFSSEIIPPSLEKFSSLKGMEERLGGGNNLVSTSGRVGMVSLKEKQVGI
jgi:hypothetical protein